MCLEDRVISHVRSAVDGNEMRDRPVADWAGNDREKVRRMWRLGLSDVPGSAM
jgi:hypothetical protein